MSTALRISPWLFAFLLLPACRPARPALLPEVTRDLECRPVLEVRDASGEPWLLASPTAVLLVFPAGSVSRFDPRQGLADARLETNATFRQPPLLQEGELACGSGEGLWSLIDPAAMRLRKNVRLPGWERVVACRPGLLAGVGQGRLMLFDSQRERLLWQGPVANLLDAQFCGDDLLALEDQALRIIGRDGRERKIALAFRAASPFLLDGRSLYVGTASRELVKVAWPSGRVGWRRRLGVKLETRPGRLGRLIVAAPGDQNVWFLNSRGSVAWWQPQNSVRRHPPILLEENAVLPLFDRSLLYLRPRARQRQLFELPADMASGSPVACAGRVYYLETLAEGGFRLMQVGNRVDVEAEFQPGRLVLPGTTLRLEFRFFNLDQPETRVRVEDARGAVKLERSIGPRQLPLLAWPVVAEPGLLTVKLAVRAGERVVERAWPLQVLDPRQLLLLPRLRF